MNELQKTFNELDSFYGRFNELDGKPLANYRKELYALICEAVDWGMARKDVNKQVDLYRLDGLREVSIWVHDGFIHTNTDGIEGTIYGLHEAIQECK